LILFLVDARERFVGYFLFDGCDGFPVRSIRQIRIEFFQGTAQVSFQNDL
jgi:hypothetical protein